MKKVLITIFFALATLLLPIYSISSNALVNEKVGDISFFDVAPKLVTASENKIFLLNESDEYVYTFSNDTLTKTSLYGKITALKYFDGTIYYTVANTLFSYNPTTLASNEICSLASNIVDFTVTQNTVYLLTNTTLYSFSLQGKDILLLNDSFTSLKAITFVNDTLYLINTNKLYKYSNDITVLLGTLSQRQTSEFNIVALNEGLLVLEKDKNVVSLFSFNGELISTLLESTDNVLLRSFKGGEVFAIDCIAKYNNELLVCDSIAKSLQSFSLSNNSLVFNKILLASSGADDNRLNHAQDFDILTSNMFVFADTDNNRISLFDLVNNNAKVISNDYSYPQIVAASSLEEIIVYDKNGLSRLNINGTKTEIPISFNVKDIVCDTLSNTYLYNSNNNKVVKLVGNTFTDIANIDNANNLQMCINASATTLYVLHNSTITLINLEDNSLSNISLNYSPVSMALDYKNGIYLLNKSLGNYEIIKMNEETIETTKNIESNDELIKLSIDLHTGKFYALNNTLSCLTNLELNLAENLLSYSSDTTQFSVTANTSEVSVFSVNSDCQAYKYPFNVSPILSLDRGDKVILLNENISENPKFGYYLVTGKQNKNIACYIQKDRLTKVTEQVIPQYNKVKIITAIANVYKFPTSALTDVDGVSLTTNLTSLQLKRDEVVEILSYAYSLKDINGTEFMCVKLDGGEVVYINKNTAINSELDAEKYNKVFQPNGKLVSKREVEIVGYKLEEDGSYKTFTTLKNNTLIYLEEDFNTGNEYTKVVYLNSNNEQISVYVLTRFVDPDDITTPQMIGLIILFFVIISSILLGVIIYKNKKPKLAK